MKIKRVQFMDDILDVQYFMDANGRRWFHLVCGGLPLKVCGQNSEVALDHDEVLVLDDEELLDSLQKAHVIGKTEELGEGRYVVAKLLGPKGFHFNGVIRHKSEIVGSSMHCLQCDEKFRTSYLTEENLKPVNDSFGTPTYIEVCPSCGQEGLTR